jgi:hypothetical protein
MDKETDKEIEGVKNLSSVEELTEELVISGESPVTVFKMPTFKLKGNKTSTEILMEMRAEERY